MNSLSVIVSKESSDSAVAEAAEEQVDCFVLKPFSVSDFEARFQEVIHKKTNPTPYSTKLAEGRVAALKGDYATALPIYLAAQTLHSKPVSAHWGAGDAHFRLKDSEKAEQEFTKGLNFQPLHYRCLTGLFECKVERKQYPEAYKLIGVISKHFPVTSHRLGAFFVATVYSGNFQDLPALFELYKKMEYRPPALVNLVTVSFLTAGRLALRKTKIDVGVNYFEIGASVSGRSMDFLTKVIEELITAKSFDNADKFLKMIPPEETSSTKYIQLKFKLDRNHLPPGKIIEQGRQLIASKKANPEIIRFVVEQMVKEGKLTLAESMIQKGVEAFPELRGELFALLEPPTKK